MQLAILACNRVALGPFEEDDVIITILGFQDDEGTSKCSVGSSGERQYVYRDLWPFQHLSQMDELIVHHGRTANPSPQRRFINNECHIRHIGRVEELLTLH